VAAIEVSARAGDPRGTGADTLVVPLFEDEPLDDPELQALVEAGEASPKLEKVAVAHRDGRRVLLAGLGKREELDAERARLAAAAAAKRARELAARSLAWAAPEGDGVAGGLVEGTLLALYRFDELKSSADDGRPEIASLEVVTADAAAVERARIVAGATNRARDLQNRPSNLATPEHLAERARELGAAHDGLEVEVHGRDWIAEQGMGAFTAVAQGTYAEPQLIVLRWRGGDSPHLAFVGKAVTFDSGGISIKPSAKMHEMKFDMSGGAAVIEAMGAIAELGLPVTVTGVVPATENMPSGRSVKPGDIARARNGRTIEVNNTDAEGRLILADALCHAVELGAERIVDLATLTGAIIVALGSTYAGLFSNDDDWFAEVEAACRETGELGWRLPLHPEYRKLIDGTYADIVNSTEARKAMSITAAEFLREFVDGRPWVHVDIAGTAWELSRGYAGKGGSGFGVRMLVELASRQARG
jgi:leucyl aminopeptidase